jgi:hypothetical protein
MLLVFAAEIFMLYNSRRLVEKPLSHPLCWILIYNTVPVSIVSEEEMTKILSAPQENDARIYESLKKLTEDPPENQPLKTKMVIGG